VPGLTRNGVLIDDTFAEAFGMSATALTLTADSARWARQAAVTMTGFATSVIGCGAEAGLDRMLDAGETPDNRPGARVLLFAVSAEELQRQVQNRVGQCVLTAPGSSCYAGLDREKRLKVGETARRAPVLARAGDGRGIRLRGDHRHDGRGGRGRQSHLSRP
jgi:formylmethanofuran--tetrahydromethanopterin N-formyltransferase